MLRCFWYQLAEIERLKQPTYSTRFVYHMTAYSKHKYNAQNTDKLFNNFFSTNQNKKKQKILLTFNLL